MSAREKTLNQLRDMGETRLKSTLEQGSYSGFSYKIFLLFFRDYEMLLTFICGFVANLPISVLFNILTFGNVDFSDKYWILYFVIYIIGLFTAIALTILLFAFTIKYTKVKSGKTVPDRIHECIANNNSRLAYLRCRLAWVIALGVVFIADILALFLINTLCLGVKP